jgi:hypothetical protein
VDLSNEASLRAKLSAWDFFVLRHRKFPNLVVHFVTFVMYWGCLPVAYSMGNPWWLLGLPLSGAIAAPSHYLFDDGGVSLREATWDPLVPFFVTILFWRLARGLYWQDVAEAEARFRALVAAGEV